MINLNKNNSRKTKEQTHEGFIKRVLKNMTIEKVRNYVNGGNYANMFIVSYDKRKVFGEKGGHRAFCLIHFASKTGGKGQSFAISKKTYLSLKNNGCKIATVIK